MNREEVAALNLAQGTLLSLEWFDIWEDSVGDPRKASLGIRHTFTMFWEVKESLGIECLVTTNTLDQGNPDQQGWCCTPLACVKKIEVIRRPKKARAKKAKGAQTS
jgi:hypothetical protein